MNQQEFIRRLTDKVANDARVARNFFHCGDVWGIEQKLKYFLDGYEFAMTGNTLVYKDVYDEMVRETGSEYQKYLELKMKYG